MNIVLLIAWSSLFSSAGAAPYASSSEWGGYVRIR